MPVLTAGKVGREFRVTLPKEVRELLELKEGDKLVFFTAEGGRDVSALGRAENSHFLFVGRRMHLHQSPLSAESITTLKNMPED